MAAAANPWEAHGLSMISCLLLWFCWGTGCSLLLSEINIHVAVHAWRQNPVHKTMLF
jgi:hypothetical protein